jgi:hypothetical protein
MGRQGLHEQARADGQGELLDPKLGDRPGRIGNVPRVEGGQEALLQRPFGGGYEVPMFCSSVTLKVGPMRRRCCIVCRASATSSPHLTLIASTQSSSSSVTRTSYVASRS